MSYLLRCSSGVHFGGVGGHICVFVFFFARVSVFILLWDLSPGVKFFLKFYFFLCAREIFFEIFFSRAHSGGCHTRGPPGLNLGVRGGGWGVTLGVGGTLILGGFHDFDDFHVFDEF